MNLPSSLLKLLPSGIGDLLIRRAHLGGVDLAASEALFKSVEACIISIRLQRRRRVCTPIDEILLLALWLSLGLVGGCGLASAELGCETGEFVHFLFRYKFGILGVLR
ncbi:hypothetical protein GB937_005237 [Aspergillus fischeri]|nr:hypothetical protein GB937_005237 [Aspergillus fischeri]